MKSLIIHLGPPKCGSSSIQQFFQEYKNPCIQNTKFIRLNTQTTNMLNQEDVMENNGFVRRLHKNIDLFDCLIVSHESLFHNPVAIKNICKFAASKVAKIIIIGYSRRASSFLISAYNQWWFRSPRLVNEYENIMLDFEIKPLHFLGAERLLIVYILNDFVIRTPPIMNWNSSYDAIEKLVSPYNAKISAGILPNKNSLVSLVQDFCNRADLTLKNKYKTVELKSNPTFNTHVTESITNAVEIGLNIPNPHSENDFFHDFSKMFNSELYHDNKFFLTLQEYIDSYFYESNLDYCNKYNLDKNYFEISKKYQKNEILDIIKSEERMRIADNTILKKYKNLSGTMAEAYFHYYKAQTKEDLQPSLFQNLINKLRTRKK